MEIVTSKVFELLHNFQLELKVAMTPSSSNCTLPSPSLVAMHCASKVQLELPELIATFNSGKEPCRKSKHL